MIRFAVVDDDAVVEATGADVPVPWWSFTKTIIAAAALALVRDGRLALDAPPPGRPFTLKHLLQHRAGLPDYGGLAAYHDAVRRADAPWPVPTLLERVDADRLRYEPGQGWDYSNVGYLFARRLIEDTTGRPLSEALTELVLAPLGATGARLAVEAGELADVDLGAIDCYHPGWVYHGLLIGPLADAAALLHRLMTGRFLPPSLLEAMRTPHPLGGAIPGRPWKTPGYGLGLMCGKSRYDWRVEGHTGGGPGSVCAMFHGAECDPPRTAAAFTAGDRAGTVERAAMRRLHS